MNTALLRNKAKWICSLILLLLSGSVFAACSTAYHGLAVVNEVFKQSTGKTDYFVEIKILSTSLSNTDYDSWTLQTCTAAGCSGNISISNADDSRLPWIVIGKSLIGSNNYVDPGGGTFVMLRDGNGDTIDYLSVAGYTNGIDTSCTPAYDWQFPSSNTKNVRRVPDGAGNWGSEPGNSGKDTEGGDNTDTGGGGPAFSVANATAEQGQSLLFDVSLSASFGSDITLTYTTQDNTAIAGTDYVGTGGSQSIVVSAGATSVTIPINTLSSGAAVDRQMRLVLQTASAGSITGQVGIGTIGPAPPPTVDHYHISHGGNAVTCEAAAVTVTAHDAAHNPLVLTSDTTLSVSTSPAVSAIIPASPVIAAGDSAVTFNLNQGSALANIDIDVSDGTASDLDDGGAEDPRLAFVDAAFRFYADGGNTDTSPIGTQIAGKPNTIGPGAQTLTLRAVQTNTDTGACEAAIEGPTTVNIAYECNDPATCTGSNLLGFTANSTVNAQRNNNGASLSYTPVSMQFDANGEAPFSFNYADVGRLTLHARTDVAASPPEPAFTLVGASNPFVVRPFGFALDYSGQRAADYADDGLLNDSTAANDSWANDANGSPFVRAGQNFALDITAVVWQAADDVNNDGLPDDGVNLFDNATTPNFGNEVTASTVTFSHDLRGPAGGSLGDFTSPTLSVGGSSSDFAGGVASASMSWDEVGIIDITASLADYLGDTAADASSTADNVGRFIPASFDVVVNDGSFDPATGTFSYTGQSFGYATPPSATIIARNANGDLTENYTLGAYMKLSPSLIGRSFSGVDNVQLGSDGTTLMSAATDLLAGSGTITVSSTPGQVIYNFDPADTFVYAKNTNSEISPFTTSLTISATSLTDADGVSASSLPSWSPSGIEMRYGRWVMENAFGPESADLALSGYVEYLDAGGSYVINMDDNTTDISAGISTTATGTAGAGVISDIPVGSGTTDLSYQAPLINGEAGFVLSAPYDPSNPGANYTGTVDIQVDLSATPWLQYDWDGTGPGGLTNHPGVSASFGQYRGHDRIIYWREVEP